MSKTHQEKTLKNKQNNSYFFTWNDSLESDWFSFKNNVLKQFTNSPKNRSTKLDLIWSNHNELNTQELTKHLKTFTLDLVLTSQTINAHTNQMLSKFYKAYNVKINLSKVKWTDFIDQDKKLNVIFHKRQPNFVNWLLFRANWFAFKSYGEFRGFNLSSLKVMFSQVYGFNSHDFVDKYLNNPKPSSQLPSLLQSLQVAFWIYNYMDKPAKSIHLGHFFQYVNTWRKTSYHKTALTTFVFFLHQVLAKLFKDCDNIKKDDQLPKPVRNGENNSRLRADKSSSWF